jgi:hypothetical protein
VLLVIIVSRGRISRLEQCRRSVHRWLLEGFNHLQNIVSAPIVLQETLDNVLVLDLDINRRIEHVLKVSNLFLLDPREYPCLSPLLAHLLKLTLLLEHVVAVLLPLSLHLPHHFARLFVRPVHLRMLTLSLSKLGTQLGVLLTELVDLKLQVILLIQVD